MPLIPTTLEASPEIVQGLAEGRLTRVGGVVRQAGSGQIAAHLQEVGGSPVDPTRLTPGPGSQALGRLLQLQHVAVAANVLNLGVSLAGFAYTAHQLHQVKRAIDSMHQDLAGRLEVLDRKSDAMAQQLGYLVALSQENQDLLQAINGGVHVLIRHSLLESFDAVLVEVNDAARFGPDLSRGSIRRLDRARLDLAAKVGTLKPSLEGETLLNADIGIQGWLAAAALQDEYLRRLEHLDEAHTLLLETETQLAQITQQWVADLSADPEPPLNTVYRFTVPALHEQVPPERLARIVRHSPESGLSSEQVARRKRDAKVEQRRTGRSPDQMWSTRQAVAAGFADFLSEASDRAASRTLLASAVAESGQRSADLLPQGTPPGLYLLKKDAADPV